MAGARNARQQTPLAQALSQQRDFTGVEPPPQRLAIQQAPSQRHDQDLADDVELPQQRIDTSTIGTKLNTTGIDPEITQPGSRNGECYERDSQHRGELKQFQLLQRPVDGRYVTRWYPVYPGTYAS
jgi:hypothetical protein